MLPCRGQNTTFIGNSNAPKPLTVQKILFTTICITLLKKWSVILKQKEPCKPLHGSFKNEMKTIPRESFIFFFRMLLLHLFPELRKIRVQNDLNTTVHGSALFCIITCYRIVFASSAGQ